ncbi:hypothetical protein PoB_003733500 [Plakobranchus ocellatus]|uniref:Uncharacterized protein n=1 Tax=Plakobranchus ocellatus TaxID=259542 RepID=A0AAV4AVA7_9GAST|nr:hypothetical protein PoB_003733500 [Plakobranchus ocellatus]
MKVPTGLHLVPSVWATQECPMSGTAQQLSLSSEKEPSDPSLCQKPIFHKGFRPQQTRMSGWTRTRASDKKKHLQTLGRSREFFADFRLFGPSPAGLNAKGRFKP